MPVINSNQGIPLLIVSAIAYFMFGDLFHDWFVEFGHHEQISMFLAVSFVALLLYTTSLQSGGDD